MAGSLRTMRRFAGRKAPIVPYGFHFTEVGMLKRNVVTVLGLWAMASLAHAEGKEVTVCVVDQGLNKNPQYYALPNTATGLICDKVSKDLRPNLNDMYRSGWSLVQLVQPDPRLGGKRVVSPILYFEREKVEAKKKKSSNSTSKGFSLFE